jgi:pyridinium-3,5-biscarboxylic acid mononucleotide sulfurtransferase
LLLRMESMDQQNEISTLTAEQQEKYHRLQENLNQYQKVIVAYSGGVDSVCLLKVAVDSLGGKNVLACIGVSESLAESEYQKALEIAEQIGAPIEVIHPKEMENPDYQKNPANRCFHCKSELYSLLQELSQRNRYDAVLCGTNVDDLGDFRPGLQAAKKFKVASPLEETGLSKEDIRAVSKLLQLPTWNQPAQPCLASRMPYGLTITPERLKQVEQGEEFLRSLGLRELRVRHHDKLVRIEVPAECLSEIVEESRRYQIVDFFKGIGFTYVSLDLQGFRSGSGNEALEK